MLKISCIVSYRVVSYCIVLYCIVLYRIVSYRIVSYRIVSYCIVLYCIVLNLYIYIALLAVHTNEKRFQCERPREKSSSWVASD